LPRLHEEIQQNQKTSPVLNFIEVTPIMGLPEQDVDQLLREEIPQLSEEQRSLVKDMTGGHPYFLQKILADVDPSLGKEAFIEKIEDAFYDKMSKILEDDIQFAPADVCRALLAVISNKEVSHFDLVLKKLQNQSIVTKKADQWQICAGVFEKYLRNANLEQQCGKQKGVDDDT
jgi:hypothetical protein